jgi:hypothetical protein
MLLGLAAPMALLAQRKHTAVGAEVGYSRADLVGPAAEGIEARQGAVTGVYLSAPLARSVFLRPELLFALKGGRARFTTDSGSTRIVDLDLAYIEIPLLARLTLATGRFRPVLFAGPSAGFQIGCDIQVVTPASTQRFSCDSGGVVIFRTLDYGLVGGGGVEVGWAQSALSFEVRYTSSVRSVIDGGRARNRVFDLMLALTF